jgi:hypothetical protein
MVAFRRRMALLAVVLPVVAGGCASGAGGGTATGGQVGGVSRWSASLKPLNLAATATLGGPPGSVASAYGNVTLSPVTDMRGRTSYDLSITAPSLAGQTVAWALYTGACNAPSPPVVPVNELPAIDVASSGAGQVRGEFSVQLNSGTTYHVNVYTVPRATDVNNVLLCGRLAYSGPK